MSGRCVAVFSGKGGVGKSTLAVALSAECAYRGKRALLVDLNTGMRGLDMLLALENRVVFDLGDVIDGLCRPQQAILEDRRTGVCLLAARQITDRESVDGDALAYLIETLCSQFDLIVLDAAAGIGGGFAATARAAKEALLLTTPDDASLRDADRAAGLLQRMDMPRPRLVINRIRPDFVDEGLQYAPEVCEQVLDLPVFSVLPDDDTVWRCTLERRPALGDFPFAWAVRNALDRLEDSCVPLRPWRDKSIQPDAAEPKRRGLFRRGK